MYGEPFLVQIPQHVHPVMVRGTGAHAFLDRDADEFIKEERRPKNE